MSLIIVSLFLVSCRSAGPNKAADATEKNITMTQEEQDKRAFALFQEFSGLSAMADRKSVLPRLEVIFAEIINDYPKAALAQQSYVNLIRIYLNDYTPALYDKAEELYQRFNNRYAVSSGEIEGPFFQAYHRDGKWEKALKLASPAVKRYIETRKLERPLELFHYSEAKFNTGDVVEAEKGYKIIYSLFPDSSEGVTARERLLEFQKKRNEKNNK
ncbi:MAG: hypothetical protein HZB33_13385 [Nitrospirae bacterium]|nr:hypothetical protein [Nitrospirota bacterium]